MEFIGNFFNYFTFQSNFLTVLSLTTAVLYDIRKNNKSESFLYWPVAIGALVMFITDTMLNLSYRLDKILNLGLHFIIPCAYIIDWLTDRSLEKIRPEQIHIWTLFPLAFGIHTLIRGRIIGWYPYFFSSVLGLGFYFIFLLVMAFFVFFYFQLPCKLSKQYSI